MRHIPHTLGLALALLAVAGPAQAHTKGAAAAKLTACETSQSPGGRFLVAEGSMKALRGATRMQMRFELERRVAGERGWQKVTAPGFGVWNSADPGIRRYVYEKRVQSLAAPGAYRMLVQFRWMRGSRPLNQQRRVTRVCRQPDLRPDLVPRKLAVKKNGRYVVRIANAGSAPSGPFAVRLVVNGTPLTAGVAASLAPREKVQLEIIGAPCAPGSSVILRVDPDGRVDEGDETRNEISGACPG